MADRKIVHLRLEKAAEEKTVTLLQGDITKETTDAIVNAANSELLPGGGVCGAIHRAGGPDIAEECRRIRVERGSVATGTAVATSGGKLSAKHVIHAVGPVWQAATAVRRKCSQAAIGRASGLQTG